jgi:hypothetical protein
MSGLLMGLTWQLELSDALTRAEKYVLLAYADHADQSGRNIFPSVDLVARKTGYSERAVQNSTRRLEENGYLIPDGQGPHGTNRYRIPLQIQNGASKIVPLVPGGAKTAPPSQSDPRDAQFLPENEAEKTHPDQGGAKTAPLPPGGAENDSPGMSKTAPEGIAPEETAPEPEVEVVFKPMGAAAPAPFLQKPDEAPPDIDALILAFPADCRAGVRLMYQIFHLLPPEKPPAGEKGSHHSQWIKELRSLERLAQQYGAPLERAMQLTWQVWNDRPFTLSHPGALEKTMTSCLARAAKSAKSQPSAPAPAPLNKPEPVSPETEARIRALAERLRGDNR